MGNHFKIIILVILTYYTDCFQFAAPTVACDNCVINSVTSYNVNLFRMYGTDLAPTNFSSQAVLAGSTIVINFPT
jgi:hypothetical protein